MRHFLLLCLAASTAALSYPSVSLSSQTASRVISSTRFHSFDSINEKPIISSIRLNAREVRLLLHNSFDGSPVHEHIRSNFGLNSSNAISLNASSKQEKFIDIFPRLLLPFLIFSSGYLGLMKPAFFSRFIPNLSLALALVMGTVGASLSVKEILRSLLFTNRNLILKSVLAQYILMPLVALAISSRAGLQSSLHTGLVLLACAPGVTMHVPMSVLSKANLALSVALSSFSVLTTSFLLPQVASRLSGGILSFQRDGFLKSFFWSMILPIFLGTQLKRKLPSTASKVANLSPLFSALLLIIKCGSVAAANSSLILGLLKGKVLGDFKMLASVALLHIAGLFAGYIITKGKDETSEKDARVMSLQLGIPNSALAAFLAQSFSNPQLSSYPALISGIFSCLLGSILTVPWGRRENIVTIATKVDAPPKSMPLVVPPKSTIPVVPPKSTPKVVNVTTKPLPPREDQLDDAAAIAAKEFARKKLAEIEDNITLAKNYRYGYVETGPVDRRSVSVKPIEQNNKRSAQVKPIEVSNETSGASNPDSSFYAGLEDPKAPASENVIELDKASYYGPMDTVSSFLARLAIKAGDIFDDLEFSLRDESSQNKPSSEPVSEYEEPFSEYPSFEIPKLDIPVVSKVNVPNSIQDFITDIALYNTSKWFTIKSRSIRQSCSFLEADPYYDMRSIPLQTYKAKEPFIGKVISVKRIVGAQATGETCNIVIDHYGKMPYWEGQSYGVIPPGINPKTGKSYTNRLYSIASSRYGDDFKGKTTTLCVRRATYYCPELKADDPARKGICSNYLCDSKPGDEIMLTGPAGKVMLMPESNPKADIIMVGTGTGIAPYRSFLRRLFVDNTAAGANFKGLAWLFLGVANSDSLLYDDEWQQIVKDHPNQFRLDYALSREQQNRNGGKMYIQDKVEEYADEIFQRLDNGAHIYFCGLKGMMPGILEMLEVVSNTKGYVWADKLKKWKDEGQWHVEVY